MLSKNKTLLLLLFLVFLIVVEVLFLFLSREGTNFVEKIKGNPIYLWVQKQKEVKIGDKFIGLSKYKIEEILAEEENKNKFILPVFVDENTILETIQFSEKSKYYLVIRKIKKQLLFSPAVSDFDFKTIITDIGPRIQYFMKKDSLIFQVESSSETITRDISSERLEIGKILAENIKNAFSDKYGEISVVIFFSEKENFNNPEDQLLRYKNRIVVLNDEK